MTNNVYDVLIVGGGPSGIACAAAAKQRELSHIILEKGSIAESIQKYPQGMTFFSTAENIAVGDVPFTIDQPKATREQALNYYRMVIEYHRLNMKLFTKVTVVKKQPDYFEVTDDQGAKYYARNVVIATGYFDIPRKLEIPGEDLPHVSSYYREPYPYMHRKVVIIGGGNSAIGAALELYRHGVDVHLIVRQEELKKTAKYWVLPDILNRIKEGSIKASFQHQVLEITEGHLLVENIQTGERQNLHADHVLILTGYIADTAFLQSCGVEVQKETLVPTFNAETYETNVDGLYLCGTVISGIYTEKVFIENGREHGKIIAEAIAKSLKMQQV